MQAAKFIEYDTDFSEEEKKQAKALKISCNLNDAACKLKLKDYKQAEKLCTKVPLDQNTPSGLILIDLFISLLILCTLGVGN